MNQVIDVFFILFIYIRRFFLWLEKLRRKLSVRVRAAITLALLTVFFTAIGICLYLKEGVAIVLAVSAIVCYIYKASTTLHSCRRLLLFQLVYNGLFGAFAIVILPFQQKDDVVAYVLFTLFYTLSWLFLTAAADEKPVQMECGIVNTFTTIVLIVINVLAVWGERNLTLPDEIQDLWTQLQYYSTVILLPLVVAGYLAALLKQAQTYWENKQQDART